MQLKRYVIVATMHTTSQYVTLSKSKKLTYDLILQMDKVISETFKTVNNADETTMTVKEEEFKKLLTDILENIMLQLEESPIAVSSNSVVHEPLSSSSTLLHPS